MRNFIGHLLSTDVQMNQLGINRLSLYSGPQTDTPPQRPYMVLVWGDTTIGLRKSPVNERALVVWVHDEGNDYTRIDAILSRVRALLESVYAQRTETGWVTDLYWTMSSSDLSDDQTHTIIRTSTYAIVASGI